MSQAMNPSGIRARAALYCYASKLKQCFGPAMMPSMASVSVPSDTLVLLVGRSGPPHPSHAAQEDVPELAAVCTAALKRVETPMKLSGSGFEQT